MTVSSLDVGEALLILKVLFLVLLYVFIWRIVRTASRDLRLPQESFVLTPGQAQAVGLENSVRLSESPSPLVPNMRASRRSKRLRSALNATK